jgi:hypothetical protein
MRVSVAGNRQESLKEISISALIWQKQAMDVAPSSSIGRQGLLA